MKGQVISLTMHHSELSAVRGSAAENPHPRANSGCPRSLILGQHKRSPKTISRAPNDFEHNTPRRIKEKFAQRADLKFQSSFFGLSGSIIRNIACTSCSHRPLQTKHLVDHELSSPSFDSIRNCSAVFVLVRRFMHCSYTIVCLAFKFVCLSIHVCH